MAEKPILFNTDMVRAILDGRKTQTRRLCKGQPQDGVTSPENMGYKPPYRPGDGLYVRETWAKDAARYIYRANYPDTAKFYMNGREIRMVWCPSIHMPKGAARLFLQVTGVRCERLQDMTTEDCANDGGFELEAIKAVGVAPLFGTLWDSTLRKDVLMKYGWAANPWVWVIEFGRCEKP